MPSDRTRRKCGQAATSFLPPQIEVRDYLLGVSGPPPGRTMVLMLAGAAALSGVTFAATGAIVFPGAIVMLLVYFAIQTPRALAVTPAGVAVMARSMWNTKPTGMLGWLGPDSFATPPTRSGAYLGLHTPAGPLWLGRKEYQRLTSAFGQNLR